jgi:CHAD domain-containing protein
MINDQKFNLPDSLDEKQFIRQLVDQYPIKKEPTVTEKFEIFDTFDWRLFNKSLILQLSGNSLFLRKLYKPDLIHSVRIHSAPVFIEDFPAGELKEQLASIIKMRALLRLVEIQSRSTPYRILNPDEKTVARLVFEKFWPLPNKRRSALAAHLWLKPVKGYNKHARKLVKHFQAAGLSESKKEDLFFKALELADNKPGSYSAKINIQLDSAMRSDQAAKVVLRFLLDVMRINEAIFEKDLDTEVLHDFRVAVRRTRSALAQIKNVFPSRTTARFKKNFAYVGKLSNVLRDLDVYLLNQDAYKAMLPAVLRDDIDPLFRHLRKKRAQAFQQVVRGLRSKKYSNIMMDWEAFLNKPPPSSATATNAELPVIDMARQRIYKRYRGIVKMGSRILAKPEDEMLHVLRIECKKLRYLLEFFAGLFPRKKVKTLIEQLKNLQDNLGDFNDLCIQQEYLLNISAELPASQRQLQKTLVAIGSLIETLDHKKQSVKDAFAKTFTDFAAPENQALFRELFAGKGQKIEN